MKKIKICAAVTALSVATISVSLTSAPPEAQAAQLDVQEADTQEAAALPLVVGAVAVGGLVIAFGVGFAQGYMEAKNAQKGGTQPAEQEQMAAMATMEFDYVLN
ncbi:MAG: hypothetical protein HC927_14155 [Deltaproteobacteria bacterium]|nr:hypothetical protein [Deltaproteobacteria bacterium]